MRRAGKLTRCSAFRVTPLDHSFPIVSRAHQVNTKPASVATTNGAAAMKPGFHKTDAPPRPLVFKPNSNTAPTTTNARKSNCWPSAGLPTVRLLQNAAAHQVISQASHRLRTSTLGSVTALPGRSCCFLSGFRLGVLVPPLTQVMRTTNVT